MANELNGKIIQIDLPTSGVSKADKEWMKQGFVIETAENYPKKVYLTMMGDKTKELQGKTVGTNVTVSFNVESREYQGKWYTDASAWKIVANEGGSTTVSTPVTEPKREDVSTAPADDLPF